MDQRALERSDVNMDTDYLQPLPKCHTPPPSPSALEKFDGLRTFRLVFCLDASMLNLAILRVLKCDLIWYVFFLFNLFRTYVHCIRFIFRLARIRDIPELLPMTRARKTPYGLRSCRKTIDIWTFTLYSHWVKRGEGMGQNRAAMFQHKPRVAERATSSSDVLSSNLRMQKDTRQPFTMWFKTKTI